MKVKFNVLVCVGAFLFLNCQDAKQENTTTKTQFQGVEVDSFLTVTRLDKQIAVFGKQFPDRFNKVDPDSIYIFNFWATWCVPCIQEIPDFKEFLAKTELPVYLEFVSLDFPEDMQGKLQTFVETHLNSNKVSVLFEPDMDTWIPRIDSMWQGAIPATKVLYKGKAAFHAGKLNKSGIDSLINTINK